MMKLWQTYAAYLLVALVPVSARAAADTKAKEPAPAGRIVSLSPSITETLFALGVGEKVVGVTRFCDYPPEAKKKAKVGGIIDASLEAIVALRPDLVIAQRTQNLGARLRELGIDVLEIENANTSQLFESFCLIGAAVGARKQAAKLIEQLDTSIRQIRKATRKVQTIRVLVIVGRAPLYVAGGGTFISELISIAGGRNIFADSAAPYPQVSMEQIIARAPEVIIEVMQVSQQKKPDRPTPAPGWERWDMIPAVAAGRVYRLKEDSLLRPGPRLSQGLDKLLAILHPDVKVKELSKRRRRPSEGELRRGGS